MRTVLKRLMDEGSPLFFVGSAKNAGKTTALVRAMHEAREAGMRFAVLSTGRDGESQDRLHGNPKPSIEMEPGELVVTTWQGILEGEASLVSPLRQAGLSGMGGLWRADSTVRVETSGLLTSSAVWEAVRAVREASPESLVMVDGALDRWMALSDGDGAAVILVVAPVGSVSRTASWVRERLLLLSLPRWDGEDAHVHEGPLTSVDQLPEDGPVVVQSPMHVFLRGMQLRKVAPRLMVRTRPNVVGVAVNPWSADGHVLPCRELVEAIAGVAEGLPVWNVLAP